ncbi:hypothetical protein AGMMS49579_13580 [Spirochaetia bacterium]|nr:hypothetical protein AGMMS49579_13580 [Spirochaetia bacterium]
MGIPRSDSSDLENQATSTNSVQIVSKLAEVPKVEISESIFEDFPENLGYFAEHNIMVEIPKEEKEEETPNYFGVAPVFVKGENFEITYSTDKGYRIEKVVIKGESVFERWNSFFGVDINIIESSWGEPTYIQKGEYIFYDSEEYWISVCFMHKDNKVVKIEIARDP